MLAADFKTGEIKQHDGKDDIWFDRQEDAVQMLLGFLEPKRIRSAKWKPNIDNAIEFIFPNRLYHTSVWDEV